jgi:cell shape-determining protein MreD
MGNDSGATFFSLALTAATVFGVEVARSELLITPIFRFVLLLYEVISQEKWTANNGNDTRRE